MNHDNVRRNHNTVHYIFYDDMHCYDSSKQFKEASCLETPQRACPRHVEECEGGSNYQIGLVAELELKPVSESDHLKALPEYL